MLTQKIKKVAQKRTQGESALAGHPHQPQQNHKHRAQAPVPPFCLRPPAWNCTSTRAELRACPEHPPSMPSQIHSGTLVDLVHRFSTPPPHAPCPHLFVPPHRSSSPQPAQVLHTCMHVGFQTTLAPPPDVPDPSTLPGADHTSPATAVAHPLYSAAWTRGTGSSFRQVHTCKGFMAWFSSLFLELKKRSFPGRLLSTGELGRLPLQNSPKGLCGSQAGLTNC